MPIAKLTDLEIVYDDLGQDAQTLLLMPGWCESRTVYAPFAQLAREKFRVLRFDWRGHGESSMPATDFGASELLDDALAVLDAARAERVTVLAIAHASWVATELRRRDPARIESLVFLDWVFTDPPPGFLEAVREFQDRDRWAQARASLFDLWLAGSTNPVMTDHIRGDLSRLGFEMWARAGREILAAYHAHGSPLRMLAGSPPGVPTLHLYALNRDEEYLRTQQAFAAQQPWFEVCRLDSVTHLPVLERPAEVLAVVEEFIARSPRQSIP